MSSPRRNATFFAFRGHWSKSVRCRQGRVEPSSPRLGDVPSARRFGRETDGDAGAVATASTATRIPISTCSTFRRSASDSSVPRNRETNRTAPWMSQCLLRAAVLPFARLQPTCLETVHGGFLDVWKELRSHNNAKREPAVLPAWQTVKKMLNSHHRRTRAGKKS